MSAAEWEAHYWSLRDPDEGNPEAAFFREELRRVIRANIIGISQHGRKWKLRRLRRFAATLRYFDRELTLEQAAKLVGVSKERFRQIKERCLRDLRHLSIARELAPYTASADKFLKTGAHQPSPDTSLGPHPALKIDDPLNPLDVFYRTIEQHPPGECNGLDIHTFKVYPELGYITKCRRCSQPATLAQVEELIARAEENDQKLSLETLWKAKAARA